MQKTVIVIHYHELWLKGRNRKFFLGKFLLGLRRAFADFPSMRMRQPGDRVVLEFESERAFGNDNRSAETGLGNSLLCSSSFFAARIARRS